MFQHLVTAYLIVLTLSGIILLAITVLRKSNQRKEQRESMSLKRTCWRESLHILVGLIFLSLFISGRVGAWVVLISTSILLVLIEYMLAVLIKGHLNNN